MTGTSPDGRIRARISGGDADLQIAFRPGAYDRYTEPELERQLASLCATAWPAWTRERREVLLRAQGRTVAEADAERDPLSEADREFQEAFRGAEFGGASGSGAVYLMAVGMTRWHAEIEDGALRRYSERTFVEEIHSAYGALLRHRDTRVTLLTAELYDMGIPRELLEFARTAGITFRNSR